MLKRKRFNEYKRGNINMPMPQEREAKKFALKRIKDYARMIESEKMKKPSEKDIMEQADSAQPAMLASELDPKKALLKTEHSSAMSKDKADGPNDTQGDNEPRKEPEMGSPMDDMDRDALIKEYERLSKKRQ